MNRRAQCLLAGSCVGLVALGCGRDSTRITGDAAVLPEAPATESEYRVVLGTGARAYAALADGEHATLIAGPQGAYHVWTSFLSDGFDSDVLRMQISTGWDDAPGSRFEMRGDIAARPVPDAVGDSVRVMTGWPAVVHEPLCQGGRALRVDLSVSDGVHSASDTRRWILDVPAELRPSDCSDAGAP